MGRYSYQAKNLSGQILQGEVEAKSESDVRAKLLQMNMQVLRIGLKGQMGSRKAPPATVGIFSPRVKTKDMQIFTRQFATLINAGIPVVDALKILGEGLRPGLLKDSASKVKLSIETGRRLAESMALIPNVFDRLYCNMIQAGEEAGILDGILNRLATYMEKSEKIKSQVKGAMVYPTVIILVAILVISGILVFIIPKFQEFFNANGKAPPMLTQMVVKLSGTLIKNWYLYIAGLIGLPILFLNYIKTDAGREQFETFCFRAPVLGELVSKQCFARLTRTLSTLLGSGVGLIDAVDIASKTSGNIVIEKALLRCKDSVMQGKPFALPLSKDKVFPSMVVQMISIGEQSGTLDVMLGKIADFYEDEVENAVKALTSLIEPLLMVVLGGIIAVLVIAMYLPIFNMADVVGGG
ncbi:MAG: type II secretion system F family protein [Bdellovibrionota bacterium]